MTPSGSLKFRLYATAVIAIAVALGIAAVALTGIFEKQVQLRMRSELGNHMLQLISKINLDGKGSVLSDDYMADPRFEKPYSGLYWSVQPEGGNAENSRSLWDQTLATTDNQSAPGRPAYFEIEGPDGQELYVMQETVIAATATGDRKVVLNVAIDHVELDDAVAAFRKDLLAYLGIIAALLMAATWLQVGIGLSPLRTVRNSISQISSGEAHKLDGQFPSEVRPLVDEINELVAARDESLDRARARAGDLAHGLRTPLTVMGSLASDIERAGKADIADALREQTELMRRNVERELARARMASGRSTALFSASDALERMIKAVQRMPRGDEINWKVDTLPLQMVAVDGDDLLELFGNLLDNARKWAASRVRISMVADSKALLVTIEDDGPGVAEEKLKAITARGQRLDESRQGSGLGLAIVDDLSSAYGLSVGYSRSQLGGLAATITFPLPAARNTSRPGKENNDSVASHREGVGIVDAGLHLNRGNS